MAEAFMMRRVLDKVVLHGVVSSDNSNGSYAITIPELAGRERFCVYTTHNYEASNSHYAIIWFYYDNGSVRYARVDGDGDVYSKKFTNLANPNDYPRYDPDTCTIHAGPGGSDSMQFGDLNGNTVYEYYIW